MKKAIYSILAIGTASFVVNGHNAEASTNTYKVKNGDSLYVIAQKYHTSINQLKKLNHLNSDMIYVGQNLKIKGNSITKVSTASLKKKTISPIEKETTYKVQSGDYIAKIAANHHVSLLSLMKANNLKNDTIYVGQTLKIPSNSTVQVASTTSTPKTSSSKKSKTTTYKVKSGDYLAKIAAKYNVSISSIQKKNNLKGNTIFIGQTLTIPKDDTDTKSSSANKTKTTVTTNASTHTVVAGDTLSTIANQYGITITQLKSWNGLTSDIIRVGQKLNVKNSNKTSQQKKQTTTAVSNSNYIQQPSSKIVRTAMNLALSFQGVPYVWGGASPSGFDCSGFIYYVYKQAGYNIARTSAGDYEARSYYVSSPKAGDLVFFKNTYKQGISHMGIYIGNGQFIHAGGDYVQVSSVNDSYWKSHFDSFKRFYDLTY